ncbi:ATP-dependent Clp protease proteolytic subunit, putative [Plasmodium knowlesi strain H]|uniref:ATP-dependent Clp protease proteolytic subunit n=3 Tax=Plasmodium knowlesi TaxID=5850 RepID=A0A5K1VAX6_PLAKH|nr:ATP-dependent Clp protease proteolytic subunit, putative [Plasmodium knowlesi strain H]OTN65960.1 ATP-dependent Clp protease proteolytic subunit [Plasmodium knowlesi]CAA9987992.1 ATP-dependent Clp protease proteolytic subunit, putative [Plasmodium knowlesi strain H]SBO22077.1 ATP-dependent Clp protease proteolytic subunit, putative [Plasmodium knowlesi strain H]SBO29151.1 ATP-dependent Clp protease proteolytic subunit, putative [Plasmodium knowlesi strain H]VVS77466.1 ATP-dependent Clp prot|eukprot:XP_002258971.1 ATP-dependent CLP protease, putative [Plasmodium knowlesi strain H]
MVCLFSLLLFTLLRNNRTHAKRNTHRLSTAHFIHFPGGEVPQGKARHNWVGRGSAVVCSGVYSRCTKTRGLSSNSLLRSIEDEEENATLRDEGASDGASYITTDGVARSDPGTKEMKSVKNGNLCMDAAKGVGGFLGGEGRHLEEISPEGKPIHKGRSRMSRRYRRREGIIPRVEDIKDMKKDLKLFFFKKRIIYLTEEINKKTTDEMISQLLYLDNINHDDIKIYINSPGGSINEGLAILDIFNYIKSDIQTISFGLVASMASVILASGKKGKRKSLPNCRIMIHQPLGNAFGQPQDIEIQTKEILYLKKLLYNYLSTFTNQTTETIEKDSDRDHYMNALEAKRYGIIDEVIETKLPHPYFDEAVRESSSG